MSAHRPASRVVEMLLGGRRGVPLDDRRDAEDLAPALTHASRAELYALGRWLFGEGDAPDDALVAYAVRLLGDEFGGLSEHAVAAARSDS